MPARQGAHDDAPSTANVPASHAVGVLVPSHAEPAGHCEHNVRVRLSPPDVKKADGHELQLLAPSLLYIESLPHGVHALAPTPADVPAVQLSQ